MGLLLELIINFVYLGLFWGNIPYFLSFNRVSLIILIWKKQIDCDGVDESSTEIKLIVLWIYYNFLKKEKNIHFVLNKIY